MLQPRQQEEREAILNVQMFSNERSNRVKNEAKGPGRVVQLLEASHCGFHSQSVHTPSLQV